MYPDTEAGYLLTKIKISNVGHETSLLLVDFNVGEDLDYTEDKKHIERTVDAPQARQHARICTQ